MITKHEYNVIVLYHNNCWNAKTVSETGSVVCFSNDGLEKKTIIKFPISLKMLVLFLDILVLVVYVFPWPFIAIEARQEECFFNNIKCLTNNKNIPLPISRNRRLITKPFW